MSRVSRLVDLEDVSGVCVWRGAKCTSVVFDAHVQLYVD
jgi:hypothetical protein